MALTDPAKMGWLVLGLGLLTLAVAAYQWRAGRACLVWGGTPAWRSKVERAAAPRKFWATVASNLACAAVFLGVGAYLVSAGS